MIISKGKIVADGTPEDLRKQATGREVLKLTIEDGDRNAIFSALQKLDTIEVTDFGKLTQQFEVQSKTGTSSRRAVFELCKKNGWFLTELTPIETKLEDIFREVTLN
jgi:ABC-2 type transport system ATP-binding protein